MTQEATVIEIREWESALSERHDMFEYRVVARVEYVSHWAIETIKGYTMAPTINSIMVDIAERTNCDSEWVYSVA